MTNKEKELFLKEIIETSREDLADYKRCGITDNCELVSTLDMLAGAEAQLLALRGMDPCKKSGRVKLIATHGKGA
jgi:hypothetical protein